MNAIRRSMWARRPDYVLCVTATEPALQLCPHLYLRHRADQHAGVFALRGVEDLGTIALFDDLAAVDQGNPVAKIAYDR